MGAKVNTIRSVEGSLRCVSAGINSYASFCSLSLLARPFSPPIEGAVILRGSSFGPGRAFRNYLGRLKKACILADCPLSWYAPLGRDIARGLRLANLSPFELPNFIYTKSLYRAINSLG